MYDYHEHFECLPRPALYSRGGKPLLSWRVYLCKYLGHEDLLRQFKLDEAWDSEHNKKLLAKMPHVYALPGIKTKEPFTTFCRVFVGGGAVFEDDPKAVITLGSLVQGDGTCNTILLVEAGEAVPWTKPGDLAYDPSKALPKLGVNQDGFHIVTAAASVRFVEKGFEERALRAAITRDGGEDLELPGRDVTPP